MRKYVAGGRKSPSITNAIAEMHVVKVRGVAKSVAVSFEASQRHQMSEDLVQVGMIGLLDAMQKFCPKHRVKFWTFASARVKGAMLDYLRDIDPMSRLTRRAIKCVQVIESEGGQATVDEVRKRTGLAKKVAVDAIRLSSMTMEQCEDFYESHHLDRRGRFSVEDRKQIERKQNNELRESLVEMMRLCLSDRERSLMTLYHLDGLTMKAAGELHGVGEPRARQLLARAMRTLKKHFPEFEQ